MLLINMPIITLKKVGWLQTSRSVYLFTLIVSGLCHVYSKPVHVDEMSRQISALDDIIEANKDLHSDLFDTDLKPLKNYGERKRRSLGYKTTLWPGGIVPYVINPIFQTKPYHLKAIQDAINEYNTRTKCVRLVKQTTEIHYLSFEFINGCWSYLGYTASLNGQVISIADGCALKGTVLHEIKHALGFHHEHVRMDRDAYIKINWNQISEGSETWFMKENEYHTNYGTPYDKKSIMHYSSYAFAKNFNAKTIISKENEDEYLGQRLQLSDIDIQQLDLFYCAEKERVMLSKMTTVATEITPSTPKSATISLHTLEVLSTQLTIKPTTTMQSTNSPTTATQSTSTPTTTTQSTSMPTTTQSTSTPTTTTQSTNRPTTTTQSTSTPTTQSTTTQSTSKQMHAEESTHSTKINSREISSASTERW